jgi:mycothiol synthase
VTPTLRGLTAHDIPAWNTLLGAVEAVDRTGDHYNEDDLAEEMANPDIDPTKDMVGVFAGDVMVGYFAVRPRTATAESLTIYLEGSVHPAHRGQGIGTTLVEAMLDRARAVHLARRPDLPARFSLSGLAAHSEQEHLLNRFGLVAERWNFAMRAQLPARRTSVPAPDCVEIREYDDTVADAMRETHNTAFRDHPNFTPWTVAEWRQWVTGSRNFRPDLSFVAVSHDDRKRVVGYIQTNEFDAYLAATGRREAYVGKVGTLREFRGKGVAASLLQHVLEVAHRAGYDEAALDVDSENPTGALGVYLRAGFEVETRRASYAKTVPSN